VWDGDSQAGGNQVGSFTLNSTVDLTVPLNAAFEGHGGATGEYDVYSATIPANAFVSLAGGSATFNLALAAPGLGVLGSTDFNGAGVDFRLCSLSHQLQYSSHNSGTRHVGPADRRRHAGRNGTPKVLSASGTHGPRQLTFAPAPIVHLPVLRADSWSKYLSPVIVMEGRPAARIQFTAQTSYGYCSSPAAVGSSFPFLIL
jgi:hypothetical protein